MQSDELSSRLAVLDRDLIENLIRDIHQLGADAKFEAMEKYLAPQAEFEYIGDRSQFPFAGRYVGKSEIIDLYRAMNTEIEIINGALLDIMIDGNRAFSRRWVDVRHRGTGARESHEIWDTWKFRDGEVEKSVKLLDISAFERLQGVKD